MTDIYLTHLSRMDFPILIKWTSLFLIEGLLAGVSTFIQILIEHSASKACRSFLIRRRDLWRLI